MSPTKLCGICVKNPAYFVDRYAKTIEICSVLSEQLDNFDIRCSSIGAGESSSENDQRCVKVDARFTKVLSDPTRIRQIDCVGKKISLQKDCNVLKQIRIVFFCVTNKCADNVLLADANLGCNPVSKRKQERETSFANKAF